MWLNVSPTFWLVGVGGGDVLGEHPQALLALVVQPQIHLPPRLVLLRRLALKVPLTVAHPQLVRFLRKPLREEWNKINKECRQASYTFCSSDFCTLKIMVKITQGQTRTREAQMMKFWADMIVFLIVNCIFVVFKNICIPPFVPGKQRTLHYKI